MIDINHSRDAAEIFAANHIGREMGGVSVRRIETGAWQVLNENGKVIDSFMLGPPKVMPGTKNRA